MAKTHNVVVPHMLVDGDQEALSQTFIEDGYDDTLTGDDQYVEADLVEVASGKVLRSQQVTPANVPALFLAGANWSQPFALTRNGVSTRPIVDVPLNRFTERNVFVMTYQDGTADGTAHEFLTADLQSVQSQERREIAWNDTEKCYTVRAGTTNPTVTLLGVFKGVVGDSNVRVLVHIDPAGAS